MNNEQFRRMIPANSAKSTEKNGSISPPATSSNSGGRPAALGSRLKSSIPMTPRSVAGTSSNSRAEFARQLAERNRAFEKSLDKNKKKPPHTSAPKGTKFAAGYVDRAKTRQEQQDEQDEREARIKALEESLKKGEIDQATHDRLRSEIAGGDLSSTHLVKGLDFTLLERIRRGEDVTKPKENSGPEPEPEIQEKEKEEEPEDEDPDAILERLETAEVKAIEREKVEKKGQIATTALNPGQKRTRAQIIAELKASREAAKAKPKEPESTLGSRFKKIGVKQAPGTRIERDSKGREVMIIVDEDGHERRKVRKIDTKLSEQERREREAEELAKTNGKVLGMEVPEFYKQQLEAERLAQEEKDKEITIFDDVESDYDPLAGLEGSDSDDSEDEQGEEDGKVKETEKEKERKEDMPPPPPPGGPGPRNWFKDSKAPLTSEEEYKAPSLNDPTFLAALKKAKAIAAKEKSEEERIAAEREARLRKKLAESNRDDDDLDLGFGSSRMEDEADLRDEKVKVSEWRDRRGGQDGGEDDYDDDGEDGGGGKGKRKRGGKKKKGDKNNFADVMKVIEQKKKSS